MTYEKPTLSHGLRALEFILGSQDKAASGGDGQCDNTRFCGGHELDD